MGAAGQATRTDTDEAVDAWAGEITKKWTSLVAQKPKVGDPKPQAPATTPLQDSAAGIAASQDASLLSQALEISTPVGSAGRSFSLAYHTNYLSLLSSTRFGHQALLCCCDSGTV